MSVPIHPRTARARLAAVNEQLKVVAQLPEAVAAIGREISVHDGFASKGESAGRGSSDLTSVEAAASATEPLFDELQTMSDTLDSLTLSVSLLVNQVRRRLPSPEVTHSRCTGGRTIDPWSRPECTNWVDYSLGSDGLVHERGDGLCTACRKRKQRWEKQPTEQADITRHG